MTQKCASENVSIISIKLKNGASDLSFENENLLPAVWAPTNVLWRDKNHNQRLLIALNGSIKYVL